ncbi:MAG: molybdenum cofactor guanylyltransferase [Candidatus Tumulicola sp.]
MTPGFDDAAIVLLAGGMATRFPGKLAQPIDGEPMLQRVYRNARATGLPVYVAGSVQFGPAGAARPDAPILADRWPGGGPLRALFSACQSIAYARVFALAADEPQVGPALIRRLVAAWRAGDEAVVPVHGKRIEPLAALYVRNAVLRETGALLADGNESMRALLNAIQARLVTVSPSHFANVNTPGDFRRVTRGAAR